MNLQCVIYLICMRFEYIDMYPGYILGICSSQVSLQTARLAVLQAGRLYVSSSRYSALMNSMSLYARAGFVGSIFVCLRRLIYLQLYQRLDNSAV